MFIMYMADLADFVTERQVNFHLFADDTQAYSHCLPSYVDKYGLTTRGMHYRNWPLDVCQSSKAQRRRDRACLD